MSFVRPTSEQAATSLGFDMGRAYAIRATLPQGKTQEAIEHQIAEDSEIVGLPNHRGLFRRHWRKGYHYWHVYLLARAFFERASPDAQLIHIRTRHEAR